MGYDTDILGRLLKAGLKVVEVEGWKTRGSSTFHPRGSVDHHTAGGRNGNAPSLGICINGRAGLPGPLCNVLVGRDGTCYIIAAGRANHAGQGGWKGLAGNSMVYGVERENVGTGQEPWRPEQTEEAAKLHAALIRGIAYPNPDLVCGHKEWAPTRKSDAHSIGYIEFRNRVAYWLGYVPQPEPVPQPIDEEEQMIYVLGADGVGALYYGYYSSAEGKFTTKLGIPGLEAYELFIKGKGFGGHVRLAKGDLVAIPFPNGEGGL